MPESPPQPDHGFGYEIFHGMKQNSEKIAQYIATTDESETHGEVLDKCIRVAINLEAENLTDDDVICLCLWNSKNSCVPYIAGLFLAKKVAAIDPAISAEEKAKVIETSKPKIIFVDEKELSNVEEALKIANLKIKLVVMGNHTNGHQSFDDFLKGADDDVKNYQPQKVKSVMDTAIIFFSSGTSGIPKGICISHYAIMARTSGVPFGVTVAFVQLNWISYAMVLLRTFRLGGAMVLMENFIVSEMWNAISKYKINLIFAKIYQLAEFCKSTIPSTVDISSLQVILTSGAALPKEILLNLKKLLPGVAVLQGYGLTEACGLTLAFNLSLKEHRDMQLKKPTSCGVPMNGIWYKIVDPDTDEIIGPNQEGELRLKSKFVMNGYHNRDSTEAFDKYGWLKTGDILWYDEDKCFFVSDRIKDMIICRDWTISPTYLEQILMSHPDVQQAAVVGIPHPVENEHPTGFVKLRQCAQVDPTDLEKFVNSRVIEKYKLRGGVKIIDEVPFTSTGKVLRRALKQMVVNGEI